jgi:hypothetical protein
MKMIKSLILAAVLIVALPMASTACPYVPSCNVGYQHTHQMIPQVVMVQPVPQRQQFNMIDMVESMVYISGGVSRIAGDYYSIRGMGHNDDYQGMWNKRYKYGLDTRANTGYGVRRYSGHGVRRHNGHGRYGYRPVHYKRHDYVRRNHGPRYRPHY